MPEQSERADKREQEESTKQEPAKASQQESPEARSFVFIGLPSRGDGLRSRERERRA